MKTSKRILILVLAAALLICTCGCSLLDAGKEEAVKTAVSEYLKSASKDIADVNVTDVEIISEKDLDPAIVESYNLGEKDLIFSITYDITVADGVDANLVAIPDGEVDGQTVKGQHRVGVVRYADGKYTLDSSFFGTGF